MATVSKFNVLKTDGNYEERDLAAQGINITIGYDTSGNIITDSTAATTTKNASQALKDLISTISSINTAKAPTNHRSTGTSYGIADVNYFGHVKIGSNITQSGGVISINKDNVVSALGYTPPESDTTYTAATTSVAGLMSAADKTKLDDIATNANNYVHPTISGYRHIPAGGASTQILTWISDGQAVWAEDKAVQLEKDLVAEIARAKAKEDELQAALDNLFTVAHTWTDDTTSEDTSTDDTTSGEDTNTDDTTTS